jgi:hypothetical protein
MHYNWHQLMLARMGAPRAAIDQSVKVDMRAFAVPGTSRIHVLGFTILISTRTARLAAAQGPSLWNLPVDLRQAALALVRVALGEVAAAEAAAAGGQARGVRALEHAVLLADELLPALRRRAAAQHWTQPGYLPVLPYCQETGQQDLCRTPSMQGVDEPQAYASASRPQCDAPMLEAGKRRACRSCLQMHSCMSLTLGHCPVLQRAHLGVLAP